MITKDLQSQQTANPSRSWKRPRLTARHGCWPTGLALPPAAPGRSPPAHSRAPRPRATPAPRRGVALGVATGSTAMVCVGGSVAVSKVLAGAPVFTAEAVRYGAACLLLVALARITGRPLTVPRGTEWLWLAGIAVTGLVLFNLALVEGSGHAEPAVLGVAVACVPAVLAIVGPLLEGVPPQNQSHHRRAGGDVRRRPGPGARPGRRHRPGLGGRGLRLRGRVHPAGHPGPGPARPVGSIGARHLARHRDVRGDRGRPRRPGRRHRATPAPTGSPSATSRSRSPRRPSSCGIPVSAAWAPAGPACSPGSPRSPRRAAGCCSAARRPGRWSGRAWRSSRPA